MMSCLVAFINAGVAVVSMIADAASGNNGGNADFLQAILSLFRQCAGWAGDNTRKILAETAEGFTCSKRRGTPVEFISHKHWSQGEIRAGFDTVSAFRAGFKKFLLIARPWWSYQFGKFFGKGRKFFAKGNVDALQQIFEKGPEKAFSFHLSWSLALSVDQELRELFWSVPRY